MTDTTQALAPIEQARLTLQRMQPEFAAALPPQIPVERFIRTTMTAISMQPDLLQADRRSLLASTMKAAQDGLLPDGREAALVIFRGKAGPAVQYMPMIGGILKKLRNSGELASIAAHVVYEQDRFVYTLGDNESILHEPLLDGDRGKPKAVYAIARLRDGSVLREVMTITDVEKVRSVSRARDSGPWVQWWDEMARKTVLRRLAKRLPSSSDDVNRVLDNDDETFDFSQKPAQPAPASPLAALRASIAVEQPAEPIAEQAAAQEGEEAQP
jgi:recombination protein RecT